MKKIFAGVMVVLLVLGILMLTTEIKPVRTSPSTIIVPDDYLTIQGAINHASLGDIIFVKNGVYHENVELNKTVLLVGENSNFAVIDGNGVWSRPITVTADEVTVTGFTLRNSRKDDTYAGVALFGANFCNISYNVITNSCDGICAFSSSNNTFCYNIIYGNSLERYPFVQLPPTTLFLITPFSTTETD